MPHHKPLFSLDSGVTFSNLTTVTVLLATLLAYSPVSLADENQARDIEQQVASAIQQRYLARVPESRVKVTVNPVNSTLSFPACDTPLQVTLPYANGDRVTAKASCASPRPWSLFVTARVEQYMTVVTAATPIARRSRISASALALSEKDISRLNGKYYTRIPDVTGLTARMPISNGEVITPQQLQAALAVNKNDLVTLEVRKGALLIQTKGIALENGHVNQQIDVRNQRSGRVVRGTVSGPGVVTVH